jgi:phosphate transport system substrate-binding protein
MVFRRICLVGFSILFVFFMIGATGCGRRDKSFVITLAGSTSVQPFAEKLAEEYMFKYPLVQINIQGGGSTAGIQAVKNEIADIGTCSRRLREGEKDLNQIVIAQDGLAVIVHPQNKIEGLKLEEIRRIFTGEITNWNQLGGDNKSITCITREEGSGTRGAFTKLVMAEAKISPSALVQDSNGSVREVVSHDPNAIGYISLGLVNEQVKALKIDGVLPTPENIKRGSYSLVRPFLFLIKQPPQGEVKKFIDFVIGQEGQDILVKEGLLPAKLN